MADLRGFNANNIESTNDYEPIPAGCYTAVVINSEMKTTKAGNGRYLQIVLQITEGEHRGRLLWVRFNIQNSNPQAKDIAEKELAALCKAVGVLTPNDSAELHDLPMTIHVRCKKRSDTGEIVNEVKGYSKKESPPPAQTPASGSTTPPWKR